MDINELNDKLKEFKAEEIVWIIYIGIIILSFYSNELERKYFINNDLESKKKYTDLMIAIFVILLIVYMYFANSSLDDVRNLKENDSTDKKRLTYLSFVGSFLILISGIIFLYIAFQNENLDVELAFN